ncbi:hypothetical protein BSKO_10086 [Bryopsis sp. KO-2023]|nr:hypothetical protein BSKO_10086 [Bryopsis sp. KO-2023]
MISGVPCGPVERSGTLRDVVPPIEINNGERPNESDLASTVNDSYLDEPLSPPRPEKRSPFANGPPGGTFPPFAPKVAPDRSVGPSLVADQPGRPPLCGHVVDHDKSTVVRFWRDDACEECRNIPKWLKAIFRSPRKPRRLAMGTFLTYKSSTRKSSKLSSILATHGSSSRLSAQLSTAMGSGMENAAAPGRKGTWRTRVKFTLRNLLTRNKKPDQRHQPSGSNH